jgi:hypothetical protein
VARAPRPSSLADVLDLILDKGLVIDAYVRVSLVGIELLTIDARVVIASVDTYLHYAEAVNRLDLQNTETAGIPALFGHDSNGSDDGGGQENSSSNGGSRELSRSGTRSRTGGRQENGGGRGDSEGKRGRSLAGRLGDRGRWDE